MSPVILTDQECIELCWKGALEYFKILYERYHKRLFHFVKKRYAIFKEDRVEEIVQEAFLRARKKIREIKKPDRFYLWLIGIAIRVAKEEIRKEGKLRHIVNRLTAIPGAHNSTTTPDEVELLMKAIGELPYRLRQVIILAYFEKITCKQIAKELNTSLSTVYRLLGCAYEKLYRLLSGDKQFKQNNRRRKGS